VLEVFVFLPFPFKVQNLLTDTQPGRCYRSASIRQKEIAMLVVTRRPGEAIVIELPTGELI
jgi:carbon storage regulator